MHNNKLFPVFEDGSAVLDNLVASVKKISNKITVPVTWQANNVLMLDNTRFLHGRNKIENPDQRHILTYFGYLKFAELGEEEDYEAPWRKKDKFQELFGY